MDKKDFERLVKVVTDHVDKQEQRLFDCVDDLIQRIERVERRISSAEALEERLKEKIGETVWTKLMEDKR